MDASSHKLNLRTDLRWLAKRTRKSTRKCAQFVKISHLNATARAVIVLEKNSKTCVDQRRVAKRRRKQTQVFNLRPLAPPFGQAFREKCCFFQFSLLLADFLAFFSGDLCPLFHEMSHFFIPVKNVATFWALSVNNRAYSS